jgi:hypothetical protein
VFARCGKILVVLALVVMTGAHWAALQTVAWTTMLACNLQTQSFAEAMTHTFDGRHPCCLCKAIAAAQKSEQKSAATPPSLKQEYTPLAGTIALFPPSQFSLLPEDNFSAASFSSKPPLPPPRRLPA